VLLVIVACGKSAKLFADFNASLPAMTVAALQLGRPVVLIPIAVLTSLSVVAGEVWLKSENMRLGIQMANLCLWLAFACYCIIVVLVSFANLVAKLS
jgi:hypothetical protein